MAITQIPALRTWVDGQAFSARDYVYERNLVINKVNELVQNYDVITEEINIVREQVDRKVDILFTQYPDFELLDPTETYMFVNYQDTFGKIALEAWAGFYVGLLSDVMYKETYDSNNDGVVNDSDRFGGQLPIYYETLIGTNTTNIATNVTAIQQNATNHQNHLSDLQNPHQVTASQVGTYTTGQIDNLILEVFQQLDWKEMVPTYADLAITYADAVEGWVSTVAEDNVVYRYDGTNWVAIQASGIPSVTDTVAGLMTSDLYTKLLGIEAGATADLTAAEIKQLYESNPDTNAFNNTLINKLNDIEFGATQDQTAAEIKTAYESNADTNALTDDRLSKINRVDGIDTRLEIAETDIVNLEAEKANVSVLGSNIILYPTIVASDVSGYYKLVTATSSPDYSGTAVDFLTDIITGSNQEIAAFVTESGILSGNVKTLPIPSIKHVAKIEGNTNQSAEFILKVYRRTSSGTETLIGTSSSTGTINPVDSSYNELNVTTILESSLFSTTDRLVLRFFANQIGSSGAKYKFKFGGLTPSRTLLSVPANLIPAVQGDIATQAEAEAGIENTAVMTPLRTAQAIVAQALGSGVIPLDRNTIEKLANLMGDLTNLNSVNKSNLVVAINEALVSGGGGGGSTGSPNLDGGTAATAFVAGDLIIDGGAS
jgi:hypothetical protein